MQDENLISELISRRRRQILIHSILYYKFNENLISDWQWSEWAEELEQLQRDYPEIADKCVYADAFRDFTHSTGYNLPLDDPWAVNKALTLLRYSEKVKEKHV